MYVLMYVCMYMVINFIQVTAMDHSIGLLLDALKVFNSYTHTYTYIHTYIHTYTYIRTYIHTHAGNGLGKEYASGVH